jgi:hypothetical protein
VSFDVNLGHADSLLLAVRDDVDPAEREPHARVNQAGVAQAIRHIMLFTRP